MIPVKISKEYKRVKVLNDGLPDITKMKPLDCVAVYPGYLGISRPFLILVDKYSGLKASWPMRDSKAESVTKLLEDFFALVGWQINL